MWPIADKYSIEIVHGALVDRARNIGGLRVVFGSLFGGL